MSAVCVDESINPSLLELEAYRRFHPADLVDPVLRALEQRL